MDITSAAAIPRAYISGLAHQELCWSAAALSARWKVLARTSSNQLSARAIPKDVQESLDETQYTDTSKVGGGGSLWPPLVLHERVGAGTFSTVYRAVLDQTCAQNRAYAVKRFYKTNEPRRIQQEVRFLCGLQGEKGIPRLEGIFRRDDEVWMVMPLYPNEPFRLLIADMGIDDMRVYMRALLDVLSVLERHQIIHRDVKPGNFLFHRKHPDAAVLVDFGLAQKSEQTRNRDCDSGQNLWRDPRAQTACRQLSSGANAVDTVSSDRDRLDDWRLAMTAPVFTPTPARAPAWKVSRLTEDRTRRRAVTMESAEAPRAGTRGFRAPEILLRYRDQDSCIDVWSAGVIFLSMLSCQYPFFRASSDEEALLELEQIFGTQKLASAAKACRRPFVPANNFPGVDLRQLCLQLRVGRRPNTASETEVPDEAFDLLSKMLELNCRRRLPASALLEHPFVRKYSS